MSLKRKAVAVVATAGILSGAGAAYKIIESHEIPEVALPTFDALPPEIPQGLHGLVCAAETVPCTRESALGVISTKNQVLVSLKDITPPDKAQPDIALAAIAKEDERFEEHEGVDVRALVRAFFRNLKERRYAEGGSGITRQLAGQLYPKLGEQTIATHTRQSGQPLDDAGRKLAILEELETLPAVVGLAYRESPRLAEEIREMILARTMEEKYSKQQILEMYLNTVYFGRGAYGVEAAARAYFGVSAKELTLHQSIILAGAIQAPSTKDTEQVVPGDPPQPDKSSPEYRRLQASTRAVIGRMLQQGDRDLSRDAELKGLMQADLPITAFKEVAQKNYKNAEVIGAQHFVDMIIAETARMWAIPVEEAVNRLSQGYTIHTTLDSHDQAAMFGAVQSNTSLQDSDLDAAGIALGKNGDVRAMVGGKDYSSSQVNMAVGKAGGGSGLPGGSTFKPIAAAGAIAAGMNLDTLIDVASPASVPGIGGSEPLNVEPHSSVPQKTLRDVIATSDNVGAARLVEAMGLERYLEVLKALGLEGAAPYPSAILGAGEYDLAQVAKAFNGLILNQGTASDMYAITKITDRSGAVIYEKQLSPGPRIFERDVAIEAIKAMVAVVHHGTARGEIPPTAESNSDAGKTGTTDKNVVVWFSGSRCVATYGGQSYSFMITNPKTKEPMANVTSRDAARMAGSFVSAIKDADKPCDLTAPSAA